MICQNLKSKILFISISFRFAKSLQLCQNESLRTLVCIKMTRKYLEVRKSTLLTSGHFRVFTVVCHTFEFTSDITTIVFRFEVYRSIYILVHISIFHHNDVRYSKGAFCLCLEMKQYDWL